LKKIALCVCTYKRVELLDKLIESLIETRNQFLRNYNKNNFDIQIIIVDNDAKMSAKSKVKSFEQKFPFINYYCEEKNGLVMARNRCLEIVINDRYDYFTFVDDDEYVDVNWLTCLYSCLLKTDSHIVFGKVEPIYPPGCPEWIINGKFFEKPQYPNGQKNIISATANVLIDTCIIKKEKEYFNLDFNKTGGEDTYFFKKYIKKGYQSVWCQDAIVYDRILPERLNEKYIYLRAYTTSYTYSEIQQKLGEENFIISLLKGVIKLCISLLIYPFFLFGKKEKKVSILRNIYSGLGRTMIKKLERY
jgi:succinoglycan biosynthesis protein ExoM